MYSIRIFISILFLLLVLGCATETVIAIDKPKSLKVKKNMTIFEAIKSNNLELADKLYLDYRGRHPESNKLPTMILKLSKAHMDAREYLLARYYAEAYIKGYPYGIRADKAWFLRSKSFFLSHKENDSSQELADKFKMEAKTFISSYPRSKHKREIEQMLKESQELIRKRNEEIALTYEKMGKDKAAKYYRDKIDKPTE
ncbi:MAG: outer membrane protein assembly factor BamD [Sulfurovum sp.]|nr:outer membrane protein assembly factor BamD [Sulfurovum sp.]